MTEAYQRKPAASRDDRGILWNKDKWNVQVYIAGVRHYIGRFTTKRAAIAALAGSGRSISVLCTRGAKKLLLELLSRRGANATHKD